MWIRHFVCSINLLVLCALVTLYSRLHPPGLKDVEDLFGPIPICITWHITILKISDVICQDDSSWSVNMLCSRSCLFAINTSRNHFSFTGTPRGLRLSLFHPCQCACNLLNKLIIYGLFNDAASSSGCMASCLISAFQEIYFRVWLPTKCLFVTLNSLLEAQNLILDNKAVISSFFLILFNWLYINYQLDALIIIYS